MSKREEARKWMIDLCWDHQRETASKIVDLIIDAAKEEMRAEQIESAARAALDAAIAKGNMPGIRRELTLERQREIQADTERRFGDFDPRDDY